MKRRNISLRQRDYRETAERNDAEHMAISRGSSTEEEKYDSGQQAERDAAQ